MWTSGETIGRWSLPTALPLPQNSGCNKRLQCRETPLVRLLLQLNFRHASGSRSDCPLSRWHCRNLKNTILFKEPLWLGAVGTRHDDFTTNGHLQGWNVSASVASRGHCQHRMVTVEESDQMHRENGMTVAARPAMGVAHVAPFSLFAYSMSLSRWAAWIPPAAGSIARRRNVSKPWRPPCTPNPPW